MLVNRWGILRKPLPANMGLKKTSAIVMCLCRLHNFCIDERMRMKGGSSGLRKRKASRDIPKALASDNLEIAVGGGIPLERTEQNESSPEQLLHGGEHFDDCPRAVRQLFQRNNTNRDEELPRDKMLSLVERQGMKRPMPRNWKTMVV